MAKHANVIEHIQSIRDNAITAQQALVGNQEKALLQLMQMVLDCDNFFRAVNEAKCCAVTMSRSYTESIQQMQAAGLPRTLIASHSAILSYELAAEKASSLKERIIDSAYSLGLDK